MHFQVSITLCHVLETVAKTSLHVKCKMWGSMLRITETSSAPPNLNRTTLWIQRQLFNYKVSWELQINLLGSLSQF